MTARYSSVEALARGDGGVAVLRAVRDEDRRPVVLKVLGSHGTPRDLERLRNDFSVRGPLHCGAVVQALGLDTYGGLPALVLEDVPGEPLDRQLGRPMPVDRFLELAVAIAAAVAEVHECGVVHKDLKPQNILVGAGGRQVKIDDFCIASRARVEPRGSQRRLEGTLPYMAPEQMGRINRAVDRRTDLYAVGVVFYEMLTGALPFVAADPLEWIHAHLARSPRPPSEVRPDIPRPISDIVSKLLAKLPEDRYQTARGLERDLLRCAARWRASGGVEPFELGAHDRSDRLQVPQQLRGRQREASALRGAFDRVAATGRPEAVVVTGRAGIGKSSLVHELRSIGPRGLFLSGKFDPGRRGVPYAALAQAFGNLVLDVLAGGEQRIAPVRQRLIDALGDRGRLVVDIVPQLEALVGPQPPVAELPPDEAKARLYEVARRFVGVFARAEHPVALFLDDLQWVDPASLELALHVLAHPDTRYLLFVGAYRDDEVDASHPLVRALLRVREAGVPITEIAIGPLALRDVAGMTAEMLRCRPEDGWPLALVAHEKTGGNPYFVIQLLLAAEHDGLLAFDPRAETWRWDVDALRGGALAADVADLLAARLRRLSAPVRAVLALAACFEGPFDAATLAPLHGRSREDTDRDLSEAASQGVVFRTDREWRFVHDRVQQAAYALIPEGERSAMHLRVARQLLAEAAGAEGSARLFDLVSQFDRAAALVVEREERERVAALHLAAGRRARASAAYQAAARWFAAGAALLPADAWSTRRELAWGLSLGRAECEYLIGHFEQAERLLDALSERARGAEVARAALVRIDLHLTRNEVARAVEVGVDCLARFGIRLPRHPTAADVEAQCAEIGRALGERTPRDLLDLPLLDDPELRPVMDVLAELAPALLFTDHNLFLVALGRLTLLGLAHGHGDCSPIGYLGFGMALGTTLGRYEEGWRFARLSADLSDKHHFVAHRPMALMALGSMVAPWTQSLQASIAYVEAALEAAVADGDLVRECFSAAQIVQLRLVQGVSLDDLARDIAVREELVRKLGYAETAASIEDAARLVRSLRGLTARFGALDEPGFDERSQEGRIALSETLLRVSRYFVGKLQARFLAGAFDEALAAAAEARSLRWASFAQIETLEHTFYEALAHAALHDAASPDRRAAHLERLRAAEATLRAWAAHGREHFGARHALVAAELARIEERWCDAMLGYEEAARVARGAGITPVEALAFELESAFFRARGSELVATVLLSEARSAYARWGADGKVRQLDREHPEIVERKPLVPTLTLAVRADQIDLLAIVKASQAISSETGLEALVATLIRIAVEQSGARRGCLLLDCQGLHAAAEAVVRERGIDVNVAPAIGRPDVPLAVVEWVRRSRESLILEDATASKRFGSDEYVARARPRSVLCLPLVQGATVNGVLYLENDLLPGVFTPDRVTLLELIAAQAAISLENAYLLRATQQAVRLRDEFVSIASHELYTPMTSLGLMLQVLARRVAQPGSSEHAELRGTVQRILRQEERLVRLVHDLLDVSRIEAGRLVLEPSSMDLLELVNEVVARFEADIARSGSTASVRSDGPVVGCWDRSRLDQVVTNLLSNAIKFGDGKPIDLAVERLGETARLRVRDHGIGIAPERQAHLFERFERAVSAQHYGGLGLGLYVSRRIVEAHGGTIRVESRAGEGATFVVDLPRADVPPRGA